MTRIIYAKIYNAVDPDGVIAFEELPPPALEAPPIVKDKILALLEKRMDPKRSIPIRESAKTLINFYRTEGFGKVRARSSGTWGMGADFFAENLTGACDVHEKMERDRRMWWWDHGASRELPRANMTS